MGFRTVKFWERWLARLGIVFLRRPDEGWAEDFVLDFIMAFHYCPCCRRYRFDRYYNPLSKSAGFCCGKCGSVGTTGEGLGLLFFESMEYYRIASDISKKRFIRFIMFFKFMLFGLGKYLPDDRQGKTVGQLEWQARESFMSAIIISSHGK